MDILWHVLAGLGVIGLGLLAVVWTFMWIAALSDSSREPSRREWVFLLAPFVPIVLTVAYYLGGGH